MVKLTMPNDLNWRELAAPVLIAVGMLGAMTHATAQSDIKATVHNLSKSNTISGAVKATSETEVCVFCHTPHGANQSAKTPLWNRRGTTLPTYTTYSSSSLDATSGRDILNGVTGGSSVLCLSCHDGVIALGNVNVLRGQANPPTIALSNSAGAVDKMPIGKGELTGYTRNLGTDLSNDHPISITYDDGLADADNMVVPFNRSGKELAKPSERSAVIGVRAPGYKPLLPLEPTGTIKDGKAAGQVQCATCHDPHLKKEKFLRLNRFQTGAPLATFDQEKDIICLACHEKLGATWGLSAHASSSATQVYKDLASDLRGFPRNKQVWQVACLNCHDTHTASGSRRLLREGTGGTPNASPDAFQLGSATTPLDKVSSIENTCYQCHNTTAASILNVVAMTDTDGVPDIKTEFGRAVSMPIRTDQQNGDVNTTTTFKNGKETHDITNADFMEPQSRLGAGLNGENHANRHVECTDCHNPHRVIKNSLFNGQGSATRRTHVPGGADGNLASGALRGTWGVEPTWAKVANKWPEPPTYEVKRGDPATDPSTLKSSTYLTREYQLCLKCHSDYGAGITMPLMTNTRGGTLSGTNGMTRFTNIAAELTVEANDAGTGADQGASTTKRSWHPVHFPTGRNRAARGMAASGAINLRAPFAANIGAQTMHCSDCHGNSGGVTATNAVAGTANSWIVDSGPNLARVQGPHGSESNFLLKGDWILPSSDPGQGSGSNWSGGQTPASPGVCGNCHAPTSGSSGFTGATDNGEANHNFEDKNGAPCSTCHIAVPHGWKFKAFLVNLQCVGSEAPGVAEGCTNKTSERKYNNPPYYRWAWLSISSWGTSGSWTAANCGGADPMKSGCASW